MAYLERTRRLIEGPDATVSTEYLKTCVYRFMIATDPMDRVRLGRVITALLNLTSQECAETEHALTKEAEKVHLGMDESLSTIASFATSSWETLFGTPFANSNNTSSTGSMKARSYQNLHESTSRDRLQHQLTSSEVTPFTSPSAK